MSIPWFSRAASRATENVSDARRRKFERLTSSWLHPWKPGTITISVCSITWLANTHWVLVQNYTIRSCKETVNTFSYCNYHETYKFTPPKYQAVKDVFVENDFSMLGGKLTPWKPSWIAMYGPLPVPVPLASGLLLYHTRPPGSRRT
jgi:hypothetical protein